MILRELRDRGNYAEIAIFAGDSSVICWCDYSYFRVGEVRFWDAVSPLMQAIWMKAYSLDFRQKIMEVHHAGGTSQRQLAKHFKVSLSFVEKLIKQEKETGSIAPKGHGGGAQSKLTASQKTVVADLVTANNDATLDELCDQLEAKIGLRVSRSTMSRLTQRLNLTVKKNCFGPPNETVKMCRCTGLAWHCYSIN